MMRVLILPIFALIISLHLTGCSLFSSDKPEDQVEQQAETTDDAGAGDSTETADASDVSADADASGSEDDLFAEDESSGAAGSETSASTDTSTDASADTTSGGATSELSDTSFPETPMGETAQAETSGSTETTADTGVPLADPILSDSSDQSTGGITTEDVAAAASESPGSTGGSDVASGGNDFSTPAASPVRKVEPAPFKRGKTLLNRVYLAREGDTWKQVSQMIYAEDKSKDLKKWNTIKRQLKAGDKVYYNSPKSPEDNAQMITYYEENGIAPMSYTTKAGENIRTVAKELIGNSRSWMELYATNANIESKGELPEGTEIKYWAKEAASQVAAPDQVAANSGASMDTSQGVPADANGALSGTDANGMVAAPTEGAVGQADLSGSIPPPPDDPFAQVPPPLDSNVPPPPPPGDMGAPAFADQAPPPPPASDANSEQVSGEESEDEMMNYYIIGGFAALVLLLVILMIKRKKRNTIDLEQTRI